MASWSTPDETLEYLKHVFSGIEEANGQQRPGLLPLPRRKLGVMIIECDGLHDQQTVSAVGTVYAVLRVNEGTKTWTSKILYRPAFYWGQELVFDVDEDAARTLHVEVRRELTDADSGPTKAVQRFARRVLARAFSKRYTVLGTLAIPLTGIARHGIEGWYHLRDDEGRPLPTKLKLGLCFLTQVPVVFSSGARHADHYSLAYAFFSRSILEFKGRAFRAKTWEECIPKPAVTLLHQNAVHRCLTKIDQYSCYLKVIAAVRDLGLGRINCMVVYSLLEKLLDDLKENASSRMSMQRVLLKTLLHTDEILTKFHGDFDQSDEFEATDLHAGLCCRGLLTHLYWAREDVDADAQYVPVRCSGGT